MILGVAVLCLAVTHSAVAQQFTVDGLAAVVGGDPIFLSDVRDAQRLRLLEPASPLAALMASRPGDPDEQVLERLIDRRLVLGEIARYAPLRPSQTEIDNAIERWRARAAAAGAGIDGVEPLALAFITDTLRIERYIAQRFTAAAHPTRDEAQAYFLANSTAFARDGRTPRFDDVEDEVRAKLGEERRLAMVREWLAGLRNRAQVHVVIRQGA